MDSAAAAQLIQVLEKTISPDQNELKAAQHFLESAAQSNLAELIKETFRFEKICHEIPFCIIRNLAGWEDIYILLFDIAFPNILRTFLC